MLGDLPLLADENIQDAVIAKLRAEGREVYSVMEEGLQEADDKTILRYAHERDWVVLTHDSDFGALAIFQGYPLFGIVYLRPGHIKPRYVLETLSVILPMSVEPPFLLIAERKAERVQTRLRKVESRSR